MTTQYAKLKRRTTPLVADLGLIAYQWGYSPQFQQIVVMEANGTTQTPFYSAAKYALQTGFSGASLIGTLGIPGVTPLAYGVGDAAPVVSMLFGLKDYTDTVAAAGSAAVVILAPASSTRNVVQPTADFIPMILRGSASQTQALLSLQTSTAGALATFDFKGRLTIASSYASNNIYAIVSNSDNTSGSSGAYLEVSSGGSSGGDAFLYMTINGVRDWALGIDNSDSDKFKISASSALGVNDCLTISASGDVSLASNLQVAGNYFATAAGAGYWMNTLGTFTYGMYASGTNLLFRSGSTSPFLTVNSSGQPEFANAVNFDNSICFNGNGSASAGRIWKDATNGIVIRAITGSSRDLQIQSNAGTVVMQIPTGTSNLQFPNAVDFTSGTGVVFSGASPTISGLTAGRLMLSSTGGLVANDSLYWATNGFLGIGSGASTPAYALHIEKATVGGDLVSTIYNSDNTNGSSQSYLLVASGGGSGGDAFVRYTINGVTSWSAGIDNSDSDKFKICGTGTPGASDYLTITTAGLVTIPAGTLSISNGNMTFGSNSFTLMHTSGTDSARLQIAAGSAISSANGAYIQLDANDLGGAGAGGGILIQPGSGTLGYTIINGSVGIGAAPAYDLHVKKSASGGVFDYVENTNAGVSAHAVMGFKTIGGAGDPFAAFIIDTSAAYVGLDNSDGDKFKISMGFSGLGTGDALVIDAALLVTVKASLKVEGNYLALPQLSANPSSPAKGWAYFNTSSNHGVMYNGTSWVEFA